MHVPVIALNANKADVVQTYADLAKSGVRIAIGNKYMAAIGRVTESILEASPPQHNFRANIVVTASTVNELLQLVVEGRVDAALVWQDMLQWQSAKGLKSIEIPAALNQIKEIRVASLSLTANRGTATKFTDFVASEGRGIFEQHGFGKK